jgi:hypothetical protein
LTPKKPEFECDVKLIVRPELGRLLKLFSKRCWRRKLPITSKPAIAN